MGRAEHLSGDEVLRAKEVLASKHYTRSVPSGKSMYFRVGDVLVVFSIPANMNISTWLVGTPNSVWELSRLWAPDGHAPNALSQAIAKSVQSFRAMQPATTALVSYADPNVGHHGGVYRAASWSFLGSCEETRAYRDGAGAVFSRRAFHSGRRCLTKTEILAKGVYRAQDAREA